MFIGRLLRPLRSGSAKLAGNDRRIAAPTILEISSPEFAERTTMPAAYRGKDSISPPLRWSNVPAAARELVLIAEDVDVPFPQPLVHAIVYGIPVEQTSFEAGAIPGVKFGGPESVRGLKLGKAAGLAPGYLAVTPIPGHGAHRYVYQLFALDVTLPPFPNPPTKKQLLAAMAGHVIARGATVGLAEA